jgi:hypothetical protein
MEMVHTPYARVPLQARHRDVKKIDDPMARTDE